MVEVQVRATSLSETQALALNTTITLDADSGQVEGCGLMVEG